MTYSANYMYRKGTSIRQALVFATSESEQMEKPMEVSLLSGQINRKYTIMFLAYYIK